MSDLLTCKIQHFQLSAINLKVVNCKMHFLLLTWIQPILTPTNQQMFNNLASWKGVCHFFSCCSFRKHFLVWDASESLCRKKRRYLEKFVLIWSENFGSSILSYFFGKFAGSVRDCRKYYGSDSSLNVSICGEGLLNILVQWNFPIK